MSERIAALKILLDTGTPNQQSIARKALKDLAQTTRKTADIEAATKALAGTPEAPKDSLGNETLPEAPKSEFSNHIPSPESDFTYNEHVGRKLAGLETKLGQPTLLDRAEAGDPEAFATLSGKFFYHDEEFRSQVEEIDNTDDRWKEFDVPRPPGQTGLSPYERLKALAPKYNRPKLFTPAEKERAERILGDQKMRCRPMRKIVEVHAEQLAMKSQLWYWEILRLLESLRCDDVSKLRTLEAKILETQAR